jgi:hypothetical protein
MSAALDAFDRTTTAVFAGRAPVLVRDLIAEHTGGDPGRLLDLAEALASERIARRLEQDDLAANCPGYAAAAMLLHRIAAAHYERRRFEVEGVAEIARLIGLDPGGMTFGELRDAIGGGGGA